MSSPWKGKADNSASGGPREVPPAGSHAAVCIGLIDLGTHTEEFKQQDGTKTEKDVRKVLIAWELTTEKMSTGDANHVITKDFNVSFTPRSALRLLAEKWRGKAYGDGEEIPVDKFIGQKCLVTVKHGTSSKGNVYANFDGLSQVPKGMTVPPAKHEPYVFEVGSGPFSPPSWVPNWLYEQKVADMVANCHELKDKGAAPAAPANGNGTARTPTPAAPPAPSDEPIPF